MNILNNKINISSLQDKFGLIEETESENGDLYNLPNITSSSSSTTDIDDPFISSVIKKDLFNSRRESDELIDSEQNNDFILIQKDNIESSEPRIMDFIKFCIKNGIFDDTFYDYSNSFSVIATKLPKTFDRISTDGTNINKKEFIKFFKKTKKYNGDIKFIYEYIDKNNTGYITWQQFTDFYLPFIKTITL